MLFRTNRKKIAQSDKTKALDFSEHIILTIRHLGLAIFKNYY